MITPSSKALDTLSWRIFADWCEDDEGSSVPAFRETAALWRLRADVADAVLGWIRRSTGRPMPRKKGVEILVARGEGWRLSLWAWWTKKNVWLRMVWEESVLHGHLIDNALGTKEEIRRIEWREEKFSFKGKHAQEYRLGAQHPWHPPDCLDPACRAAVRYLRQRLFVLALRWSKRLEKLKARKT